MANMPNKFTPKPRELTSSSWLVFISGGSRLEHTTNVMNGLAQGKRITHIRWIASNTINIEIKMRKIPLAKPDNVSILPYPYVNRSLAGQVAITEAINPTAIAMQSNAICIASHPVSGRKGGKIGHRTI